METPTLPAMLTAMDVGLWLNLRTKEVETLARRGRIPVITLPNGDLLFDQAELLMWLDRLRDRAT